MQQSMGMKKHFIYLFFIYLPVFTCESIFAEGGNDSIIKRKNSIFIQLDENALFEPYSLDAIYLFSVNYDRLFFQSSKLKCTYRFGGGWYKNTFATKTYYNATSTVTYFPLEFNALVGKSKNFLEIGLGFTPSFGERSSIYSNGKMLGIQEYNFDFIIVPRIGYRFQPQNGGLFFRIGITPIIYSDLFFSRIKEYDPKRFGLLGTISIGGSF